MKTEKKNSGEYVFTGDIENDKELEELLEKVKANTFGTVTFYAYRMGKGYGIQTDFRNLVKNTPKAIKFGVFMCILETVADEVSTALGLPILKTLSILNTKIICDALERKKEEE